MLFVPVGWLAAQHAIHPDWLLWFALVGVATCLGVWLATLALQRDRPQAVMSVALIGTSFVVWHDMTLALIVGRAAGTQAIAPGIVSVLGTPATGENLVLTAAILLTTFLTFSFVGIGMRTKRKR